MTNNCFQVYVPRKNNRNKIKSVIKSAFAMILIFFLILLFVLIFAKLRKKENNFLPLSFYFVYSSKYRKESMLYTERELLKKSGGACEIYYHKNQYYLMFNVYFEKEKAEEVLQNLKEKFPNAGVLRITTKSFSKKAKREIQGSFELKNALKHIKSDFDEVLEVQNSFVLKEKDSGKVMQALTRQKLNLQVLSKRLNGAENEMCDLVAGFIEMKLLCYEEFFEKFYTQTSNREYLLSKIATKLAIIQIKMINNLSIY